MQMDDGTELMREAEHLAYARRCLEERSERIHRDAAERLRRRDPDERMVAWLFHRSRQLEDHEGSPLFFGRVTAESGASTYIGRRHVTNDDYESVVIDWRTPFASHFYQASPLDSRGLVARRRFGFDEDNVLSSYDDEQLVDDEQQVDRTPGHGSVVLEQIERARSGPMRDIVATIQPDQDAAVRRSSASSLVIQGGPGTGKTAVGLHRAAYLLFSNERIRRDGALIVGPNDSFLSYISRVLPMLGEVAVDHASTTALFSEPVSEAEPPSRRVADVEGEALKHDARMAGLILNALTFPERAEDGIVFRIAGLPRVEVEAERIAQVLDESLRRGLQVSAARELFIGKIAGVVVREAEAAGSSVSDSALRKVRQYAPLKKLAAAIWPSPRAEAVLARLLGEEDFLERCSAGAFTKEERETLLRSSAHVHGRNAQWTPAESVLLDEIRCHAETPRRYGHLVVDEAQDLSPMQLRALARRVSLSATILGDLAQRTTPWGVGAWSELLDAMGLEGEVSSLSTSYRVPAEILELASRVLARIDAGYEPSIGMRSRPGAVVRAYGPDVGERLALRLAEHDPASGSLGVIASPETFAAHAETLALHGITPNLDGGDHEDGGGVSAIGAHFVKGLEFDHVVILEPAEIARIPEIGLRLLYVALTRAVSTLTILGGEEEPDALGEAGTVSEGRTKVGETAASHEQP